MSKLLSCVLGLVVFGTFLNVRGQDGIDATITVEGTMAKVYVKYATPVSTLKFLDSYGGVHGLASRVSGVNVRDIAGGTPEVLRSTTDPGDFAPAGEFSRTGYEISLSPVSNQSAAAHVSWVSGDIGLLMLDELLPQSSDVRQGTVRFVLPAGWDIYPKPSVDGSFRFSNADKAAFLIGRNIRSLPLNGGILNIAGDWHFTDQDAQKLASQILEAYTRAIGTIPAGTQVNILKFPTEVQPDQWEADTRGSTVTIVSSDTPFASQSIQRLHEQLRHEMFHLWFPNGVNLSGNYDWFYEGFALYQSLKLGVSVNRIRFEDYLDTLSRAYSIDSFGTRRLSLIEASRHRFDGNNTQVYARGMIVAFLCDLALLETSKGKRSTDELVRELYRKHPISSVREDGNTAILSAMKANPELVPIADRYITGADTIDWASLLSGAGLEAVVTGRETALKVILKPSGRQKDILDKLGYNNWRKSGSR